jgi:hypothetical protein
MRSAAFAELTEITVLPVTLKSPVIVPPVLALILLLALVKAAAMLLF